MKSHHESQTKCTTTVEKFSTGSGVTFAAKITDENGKVLGTGISRRNPLDRNNDSVGRTLAVARAFQNYGRRQEKIANGLVKHADDMAKQKVRAKRAPRPVLVPAESAQEA